MENTRAHPKEAKRELGMSKYKIWKILRKDLKWKSYKPNTVQVLSEAHKTKRVSS